MEKLRLKLDNLAVDSFDTQPAAADRGAVQAFAGTQDFRCNTYFCSYGSCTGLPC